MNQQRFLFILNDSPYGNERSYNALRLARTLLERDGVEVKMFLFGDASGCALAGQETRNEGRNIEEMMETVAGRGAEVGICGACIRARGFGDGALVEGVRRSNLDDLSDWSLWADKVFVF